MEMTDHWVEGKFPLSFASDSAVDSVGFLDGIAMKKYK
jgi:hypothetical protein